MSGSNPFRRSKIITSPPITHSNNDESVVLPSIPNDAITSGASSVEISKNQSSSHPKTVRIATPSPSTPLQQPSPPTDSTSPSYFPAVSFAGLTTTHRGSPPPQPQATQQPEKDGYSSSDDSESDPFDPRSSDGVVIDHAVIPPPFIKQSVEDGTSFTSRTAPRKEAKLTNTLDVDAFTRLLLTGSAEGASTTTTTTAGRRTASNPDTVSAAATIESPSRVQTWGSADDSVNYEVRQTSPQATTTAPRASTFTTTSTLNDIQRTTSLRKPKPPPPRSHRGKPIKPDDSGKDTSTSSIPTPTLSQTPMGSPSDRRGSTSSLSVKVSSPKNEPPSTAEDVSSLHRSSSQSKRPPTPPLTRRHSQMRPNTSRHSITEKPNRLSLPPKSLSNYMQGPLSPGNGTKTPPRPPSRRVERPVSGIQAEAAISQLKSSLSQRDSTPSDQLSVDEQTTQAPTTSSPPSRTPSIKQSLPTTTGMLPPPPPPPRRLRASSKSSSTTVSVSIDKPDAPTTTEQEDIQSSSHAQDILADLSRLQQEVDDLRVHYEGRKVSQ
ncbi:hypothetical protein TCE0_060r18726 [Talaromyces pinophilus]|uniref:Uncharacterized protein n=1 Tax=Talaromyces pinophilus TaxID=128442 RepID=A0A6V8HQV1_TALPI|nr:Hypothetical protein PENO1_077420 [Penicillium occitanis (nom. inval.)]PCH00873.1 hypothetical protein PENOC_051130 [Penicillium occitanis (nom. inval.)]GAM43702.1 hypothetical protein TCE0_060r18726 [Talaromyces pinophilus]